jgi:predicted DNA-binding antitoxin AbrB/MazE fold protein
MAGEVMTTAVKAIYQDGVFKPLEPLQLDELTQVEVMIPCPATPVEEHPGGGSAMDDLIGFIRNAPSDMAEHHDRYLNGPPPE